MRKIISTITASSIFLASSIVSAQQPDNELVADVKDKESKVTVEWVKPKEFRDVRPTNQSRTKFRDSVLKNLGSHISELGEKLPDNQTLSIVVTDLDLAGQVWPSSFVGLGAAGNDVRIIKDVDIPRITMSYELKDAQGKVIKSDNVKLKDMSFMQNVGLRYRNESLGYEKNMLDKWFKRTFEPQNS